MVGEGEEVGLPRTPWPDQKNIVLRLASYGRDDARKHIFHDIAAPDEEGLQGLAVHVAWAVA